MFKLLFYYYSYRYKYKMAFYMAKVMVAIYIVHTCLLDLIIERYVYIGLYAK
jgi:hypothetical protein